MGCPMPHHAGFGYRVTNITPVHAHGGPRRLTRSRSRISSRNKKL